MTAGQRMVADDGKEVMLFPLPYMVISQGENESFSHAGILAIDFLGWDANGRVLSCPMYAPCSCTCKATIDVNNNGRIFQSNDVVHTPNGLEYVTFMCFHDNNPIASVGDTFVQGEVFAHTGSTGPGVTGDHTHFNTANGLFNPNNYWENVPPDGHGELVNSEHIYEICYVNDTVLIQDYGYNWVEYSGGHTPVTGYKASKFPWVLYANKLRNKYLTF